MNENRKIMDEKFQIQVKKEEDGDMNPDEDQIPKFLVIFLNFILAILSYLIPKNKKQVVVGSYQFIGNSKHFYLYLVKNKNTECKATWITRSKKIHLKLQEEGFSVVYLKSLKGFFSILRSQYLLFSHSSRDISYLMWLPGRFNKIQMWHGIATRGFAKPPTVPKNLPLYEQLIFRLAIHDGKSYHTILTSSEKSKKRDTMMFQNKNVKIIGYPRNDIFFDRSRIYEDFSNKFNLKKYGKVIIFCPTWRIAPFGKHFSPKVPFSNDFLKEFNEYLRDKNYVLLCKKHKDEIGTRFNFPNLSNIKHISKEIDIQDLLIDVDIMITDYSSVFKDFCLTGRPIIFYPFDYEEYIKDSPIAIDYFNDLPGPFARTEQDLLNCLKNLETVTADSKYKEKYRQLVETNHFYQDGKSSERLYDYLFKKN